MQRCGDAVGSWVLPLSLCRLIQASKSTRWDFQASHLINQCSTSFTSPINIQVIFWIAIQQDVSVQGYTSKGNPLVCTSFTSDFNTTLNETITRPLYGYPPAFDILSYFVSQ